MSLVQLIGVDVGVEVRHDGEDDADAQQQPGKQQELFPLREKYRLVCDLRERAMHNACNAH